MYSVHSQHRAIQGDNYNIPYYRQLSLRWTLFELVSILETCFSYTNVQSHMNGATLTVILGCPFYGGDLIIEVSKKREVTDTRDTESSKETTSWASCMTKNTFYQPKFNITLCCAVISLLTDTSGRKPPLKNEQLDLFPAFLYSFHVTLHVHKMSISLRWHWGLVPMVFIYPCKLHVCVLTQP